MREQGIAFTEQPHLVLQGKGTMNNEADADNRMWNKPNPSDAAYWFVTFLRYEHTALAAFYDTLENYKKAEPGMHNRLCRQANC